MFDLLGRTRGFLVPRSKAALADCRMHCSSAPSLRLVQQHCCEFWLGARREEGEYPLWSLSDEQQSTRQKSAQPFGLGGAGASPAREERHRLGPSLTRRASHPAALPTLLYQPQTWCTKIGISCLRDRRFIFQTAGHGSVEAERLLMRRLFHSSSLSASANDSLSTLVNFLRCQVLFVSCHRPT